jgi:hypothetical protein
MQPSPHWARWTGVAAVLVLGLWPAAAPAAANDIFTVAGTGIYGFTGDGAPATAAELGHPTGVAVTADGGFLIADALNNRIRRVSPRGTIATVAGSGGGFPNGGFAGDGGPATAAQFEQPTGVAVTAGGGFLIADSGNRRIRRVSPGGTITTVAGTGAEGSSGDGGAATAARLGFPFQVAATPDGGFVIAQPSPNHRIRIVVPRGRSRSRLFVALAKEGLLARRGQPFKVDYVVTTAAQARVELFRGQRRVAVTRPVQAARGRRTIYALGPARPGTFTLRLTARAANGRVVTDQARLSVR